MSASDQEAPNPPVWLKFLKGLQAFVAGRVPAGESEDVLQEVLLRLHESSDSLRDASRAEAWVYGIARRTIADFYRRRRPADESLSEAGNTPDTARPDADNLAAYEGDHDVHEEVLSWLRPMVDELPEAYRQAVLMVDFEGRPQQEVAEALGLSLSGAKSRVQRGRAMLGDALRSCCRLEFGPEARATAFLRLREEASR